MLFIAKTIIRMIPLKLTLEVDVEVDARVKVLKLHYVEQRLTAFSNKILKFKRYRNYADN